RSPAAAKRRTRPGRGYRSLDRRSREVRPSAQTGCGGGLPQFTSYSVFGSSGLGRLRVADQVIKRAATRGVTRGAAGQRLPAADDRVDIGAIELQPVAAPAGALGRDHRRAAAKKGV